MYFILLIIFMCTCIVAILLRNYDLDEWGDHKWYWCLCVGICVVAGIGTIIASTIVMVVAFNDPSVEQKQLTTYDSLKYQIEEIGYDNLVQNGKPELMQDIEEYNKTIRSRKALRQNWFIRDFYEPCYDKLPLIDYKELAKGQIE